MLSDLKATQPRSHTKPFQDSSKPFIKKQDSIEWIWRSNWLYLVIHELGSILSSNTKVAPRVVQKRKAFIGRKRVGQEGNSKRKERLISGQVILCGGWKESRGVIMQITSIRIFQIDCLKVMFLRKIETTIKSWFPVMGTNNSISGLQHLFFFFFLTFWTRYRRC